MPKFAVFKGPAISGERAAVFPPSRRRPAPGTDTLVWLIRKAAAVAKDQDRHETLVFLLEECAKLAGGSRKPAAAGDGELMGLLAESIRQVEEKRNGQ